MLNQKNREASNLLETLIDRPDWIVDAIHGFSIVENENAAKILLDRYSGFNSVQKRAALDTLASRRAYAEALAEHVRQGIVPKQDIPTQVSRALHEILGDRWVQAYGRSDESSAAERKAKIETYRELCQPKNMQSKLL